MRMLKRGLLVAAVLCLALCLGSAGADIMTQADYETIVEEYRAAVTADTEEEALQHLRSLVNYYEQPGRAEALEKWESGTATVYYTYAKGMLAFAEKRYAEAWEALELLRDVQVTPGLDDVPDLPDTAYERELSAAVLYQESGAYEKAFEALEFARVAPGASAVICAERKAALAEEVLGKAAALCDAGRHQEAQALYSLYSVYVSPFEGQKLLEACKAHSTTEALRFTGAEWTAEGALALSWNGKAGSYTLKWTADPSGTSAPETRTMEGNALTLTGLLPATAYQFTLTAPDGGTAETAVQVPAAEKYSGGQVAFMRSAVTGIVRNEALLRNATPLRIIQELPAEYHLDRKNNAFTEEDLSGFSLYALVSYQNLAGQELKLPMYCILRSAASGVCRSEDSTLALPNTPAGEDHVFWLSLEELLGTMADAHDGLPLDAYTLEICVEGQLLCKESFSVMADEDDD